MYTALYRAYRPEVFDQLLGQEHITRILKNQIASGTTSHAYLFCGTRGTGKTTTARLLAKGLNCLSEGERPCGECAACQAIREGSFLDVVEIDAASNRGIDDIRQLRDSVNYPPAVGRNKVYIIDEVHMLSTEAFNALLKTLEEPPEYVTFILATTEPRKLPATILSRCLRLDFKRIPEPVLIEGMKHICQEIGIEVTEPALRIIAANADGSVRDGLSILDQCISGGDRTVDAPQVLDFLGASGETVFIELTDLVSKRRTAEAIEYLAQVLADGKDVRQLIRDWVSHYRNLLMTRFIRDPQSVINLSVENIDRVREQSSVMELEDINRGIMELSKTADAARWSTQPRILLEVCIVNLCQGGGALPSSVGRPQSQAQRLARPGSNAGVSAASKAERGAAISVRNAAPAAAAPTGNKTATPAAPTGNKTATPAAPTGNKTATPAAPTDNRVAASAPEKEQKSAPAPTPTQPAELDPAELDPAELDPAELDPEESSGTLNALDAMIAAASKESSNGGTQKEELQSGAGSSAPTETMLSETEPAAPIVGMSSTAEPAAPPETVPFDTVAESSVETGTSATSELGVPTTPGPGTRAPAGAYSQDELTSLWDEVFADGEHQKGSIYLIRSNGMLTAMDEHTFTVTVNRDLHRRQTERNRDLLEDLMEARTGQRRRMKVEINEAGDSGEISVEEAAARASEVLGTTVTIE